MPIRVVASVIQRDGKLLVCERPTHKRHGGLWEFPGGKIEPGESDLDAARRELGEELAVEVVAVGAVEFSVLDPGSISSRSASGANRNASSTRASPG